MKASGTVDFKCVGGHLLDAKGEFFARLLPLATVQFDTFQFATSRAVYLPD